MMNREQLLELIADYALDLLEPDEKAQVEALLKSDREAQQLLAEYEGATNALLFNVPQHPVPQHLHADLKRRLDESKRGNNIISMRLVLAVAAIVVLIAIGLVLRGFSVESNTGKDLYDDLVAAPDSQSLDLVAHLTEDIYGDLIISGDGQQAVMRVYQLPDVANDEAFQLWLIDDTGAVSGGVFQFDNPQGPNFIVLPLEKPATGYNRFGVSLEPATGSPLGNKPSGPRVFDVTVNS